jgi:hypothetical protein
VLIRERDFLCIILADNFLSSKQADFFTEFCIAVLIFCKNKGTLLVYDFVWKIHKTASREAGFFS